MGTAAAMMEIPCHTHTQGLFFRKVGVLRAGCDVAVKMLQAIRYIACLPLLTTGGKDGTQFQVDIRTSVHIPGVSTLHLWHMKLATYLHLIPSLRRVGGASPFPIR
jgi:hypothetical protein